MLLSDPCPRIAAGGGGGNEYSRFVQETFASVKKACPPGTPSTYILKQISSQWKAKKAAAESAAKPAIGATSAGVATVAQPALMYSTRIFGFWKGGTSTYMLKQHQIFSHWKAKKAAAESAANPAGAATIQFFSMLRGLLLRVLSSWAAVAA